jgi:feruloyl esterase
MKKRSLSKLKLLAVTYSVLSAQYVLAEGTTVAVAKNQSIDAVIAPVTSCDGLKNVDLTSIGGIGSKITSAEESLIAGKKVCTVDGVLAPTIGFKVKLPVNDWHAKYLQIGCGGLCGSISEQVGAADGCVPVTNGEFVISATDMGHQERDGSFGLIAQKRADFAFRSLHLTSVVSKTLIKAFYGQDVAYCISLVVLTGEEKP